MFSFINAWQPGRFRRFVARYDVGTGAVRIARSYPDRDGLELAATSTRFVVFGNDHWTIGRIDGGSLREIEPLGPGSRPPASAGIEPDVEGVARVFDSSTSPDGRAFVFRAVDYENVHGMASYVAYEIVEVDIDTARVIRRTRFADETGGRSPLPYAFDVRVA